MKIGIVGWGVEGQSAYRYFGPEHQYLIVNEHPRDDFPPESDKLQIKFLTEERPPGVTSNVTDLSYLEGIDKCDKIIYSVTSVKNLERRFGEDKKFWQKATTSQHIFFEEVKTKNIIGVTGTKGKGTTATLIYQMLKASGLKVFLGGNIGTSILDFVNDVKPNDWVVLELSNFQLYNFPYSPHIGVCLMITDEHQDWHTSVDEYIKTKINLFSHQSKDDIAIYFADGELSKQIAGTSPGIKIPYFAKPGAVVKDEGVIVVGDPETEVIKTDQLKLIGRHNLENICAAVTTVWQVVQDKEAIQKVLSTFTGLEHRLEFIRELGNVKYYDDSFGTTPQTAITAMKAFTQPKVMILGGIDKGLSFDSLANEVVKNRVRHAILIGHVAPKIATLLRDNNFSQITTGLKNMDEIVKTAREVAEPGDVVLLSPASSSFDMFKDYKQRGEKFKAAVRALA
ncbi:UDP-N-acetylmuramoyl-L-alanine--D-glutamate ligase [Candidatus Saccharibacteria bacterium]|nr:UDP-N-acetylmuramoyl-L-alanine--D-glutamate ligase [Candidatus Saccharibacteria bacterium]